MRAPNEAASSVAHVWASRRCSAASTRQRSSFASNQQKLRKAGFPPITSSGTIPPVEVFLGFAVRLYDAIQATTTSEYQHQFGARRLCCDPATE